MYEAYDKLKAHIAASFGMFGLILAWNIICVSILGLVDYGSYMAIALGPASWVLYILVGRKRRLPDHLKAAGVIFLLTLGFRIFFNSLMESIDLKDSFVMALALGPALWLNIQVTLYYRSAL